MSMHTTGRRLRIAATLCAFCLAASPRPLHAAELPESYRRAWSDSALLSRIEAGIERHRKGDASLELASADGRPLADVPVVVRQKTHRFLFGCNAFVLGQLESPQRNRLYEERFAALFNFATVPFYWEGTEPVQGQTRYAEGAPDMWRRPPADRYPAFARRHGLTLKGHPLLWHAYNPPWLPTDADALRRLYQKRFAEIAERYADAIAVWDVVNESLVCPARYPLFTPERAYVAWAFREAARVFRPGNTLMINEVTGSHNWGAGAVNRYYQQVKGLVEGGARLGGIGFQFHFFSPEKLLQALADNVYPPGAMLDLYDAFAAFNLPLYITEITIPTPEGGEALQAEVARNLYRLWFAAPNMAGITWWNLGDGTAVKGENVARGGLLDEKLEPKKSYRALDRLINDEWITRLDLRTDASGHARFRGFHGKYDLAVTVAGRSHTFALEIKPGSPARTRLVLQH